MEERARVARGAAQRARADARVGQRCRVSRGGAAGGARGGRGRAGWRWRGEGGAQARRWRSLNVRLGRRRGYGGRGGGVVPERDRAVEVVGRRVRERERAVGVGVVVQGQGEGDGGVHCAVLGLGETEGQPHVLFCLRVAPHATPRDVGPDGGTAARAREEERRNWRMGTTWWRRRTRRCSRRTGLGWTEPGTWTPLMRRGRRLLLLSCGPLQAGTESCGLGLRPSRDTDQDESIYLFNLISLPHQWHF